MKKIASLIAGISLLAATLIPVAASAASATMSLSGATQTNGAFSTVVYENSDGPVSSVSLVMNFSAPVSGVAYDYSVGPFTTADPSGGHLSQGSVTGLQPVARITFTLAGPGTVTASVDTSASYLKGASDNTVVRYAMTPASAAFTYNAPAPAQGGMGSGDGGAATSGDRTTTTTSGRSTAVAQNTTNAATDTTTAAPVEDKAKTEVKGDATKDKENNNKEMVQNTAEKKRTIWPWVILILVAAAATAYALRNRASSTSKGAKVVQPDASEKMAAAPIAAAAGAKKAANVARNKNAQKYGKKSR